MLDKIIELIKVTTPFGITLLIFILFIVYKNDLKNFFGKVKNFKLNWQEKNIQVETQDIFKESEKKSISSPIEETENTKDLPNSESQGKEEYWDKIYQAADNKNKIELEKNFQALLAVTRDEKEQKKIKCIYHYNMFLLGERSSIESLEEIINTTDDLDIKARAFYNLGHCYSKGNNLKRAIEFYKKTVELDKFIYSYEYLGEALIEIGASEEEVLEKIIEKINRDEANQDQSNLAILHEILAKLHKKMGNNEKNAFSLLKAIEYDPNNIDYIFNAAYAFSDLGDNYQNLTFILYKTLINLDPLNGYALNNMGVSYGNMKLPILSINAFKKAMKQNITLANSNLAYEYMQVGFYEEALEVLQSALKKDDAHKNVGTAYSDIVSRKENEEKLEKEIIEKSKTIKEFFGEYSKYYLLKHINNIIFDGVWVDNKGNEYQVNVTNENEISILYESNNVKHSISGKLNNLAGKLILSIYKQEYSFSEYKYVKESDIYWYFDSNDSFIKFWVCKSNTFFTLLKK